MQQENLRIRNETLKHLGPATQHETDSFCFGIQMSTFGVRTRSSAFKMRRSAFKTRRSAFKIRKFQTAVYPPRMAPIGLKLCQNAFQTIPDISFFDVQKLFFVNLFQKTFGVPGRFFSMICSFWKSWIILSVFGVFYAKNNPISPKVQVSTFLAEGVEGRLKFFSMILDQNGFTVFARWVV